jgi:pimeloyl-ACP methyl ester carboxylesterase/GNAT superfamily N-acetyltransferase
MLLPFRIAALSDKAEDFRAYLVASTATLNVDPSPPESQEAWPSGWVETNSELEEIAAFLSGQPDATLVIHVHGFNNSLGIATRRFQQAAQTIQQHIAPHTQSRLLYVGYRWPSEQMLSGRILGNTLGTIPALTKAVLLILPVLLMVIGLALAGVGAVVYLLNQDDLLPILFPYALYALGAAGLVLAGTLLTFCLLRVVVYFRDTYRALNYGVADLVEFIQRLHALLPPDKMQNPIRLSFIGHSMGALVATNVVRILSDVFAPDATPENPGSAIGKYYLLERLLLVSPDIPGETLLSGRANFLSASLERCKEAFLFSNQDDIVVGVISSLANYFTYPSRQYGFGRRLANVGIRKSGYGILAAQPDLAAIYLAGKSLAQLNADIKENMAAPLSTAVNGQKPMDVARRFHYLDCTEYGKGRALLSYDLWGPLKLIKPVLLLFGYMALQPLPIKPLARLGRDVHSGYFDDEMLRRLIFGMACLGYVSFRANVEAILEYSNLNDYFRDYSLKTMLAQQISAGENFEIARAEPTDRDSLLQLFESVSLSEGALPAIKAAFESDPAQFIKGWDKNNGKIIASAWVEELPGNICRVRWITVHPDYRKNNLASRLMQWIENAYDSLSTFEIAMPQRNERLERMLRWWGFEPEPFAAVSAPFAPPVALAPEPALPAALPQAEATMPAKMPESAEPSAPVPMKALEVPRTLGPEVVHAVTSASAAPQERMEVVYRKSR